VVGIAWSGTASCRSTQDRAGKAGNQSANATPHGFFIAANVLDQPEGKQRGDKSMTTTIYGIKTCDTMRKAFSWLDAKGVAYDFHDYRSARIDAQTLEGWVKALGWEKVLNKASTTFKELPDAAKADLTEAKAIALMVQNPTMIKRPMLVTSGGITAGFKPDIYASIFPS
jgi:arsenate reductase